MILIPTTNLDEHRQRMGPELWTRWQAILQEHGTRTDRGWEVLWEKYNAVSMARFSGVYDIVAHPAPELPAPAPVIQPAAKIIDRRQGGRGCGTCGGQSAVNATGSPEAINAILAE